MKKPIILLLSMLMLFSICQAQSIIIKNVNIFDGKNGKLINGQDVLIEKNLIAKIGVNLTAPSGATVIDGGGNTLMPGLIDSHVNLLYSGIPNAVTSIETMRWDELAAMGAANAHDMLMDGFTTVRDAGAMYDGIKNIIDQDLLSGPRIYPSGGVLTQTSGQGDWRSNSQRHPVLTGTQDNNLGRLELMHLIDGSDQVLAATRQNLSQGASQINMTTGGGGLSSGAPLHTVQFLPEEITAAVKAAADWDTYLMVQAYTSESVIRSLNAGAKCINQGQMMSEDAMKLLVDKGAFLVPNMASISQELINHPIYSKGSKEETLAFQSGSKNFINYVNKYQPKIAYGTNIVGIDFYNSRSYRDNNMWLHAIAFGNVKLLQSLTSIPGELAQLTGKNNPYPGQLGVIKEGAYADIIVVEGNPIVDVSLLGASPKVLKGMPRESESIKTIRLIIKDGKVYKNTLNQ